MIFKPPDNGVWSGAIPSSLHWPSSVSYVCLCFQLVLEGSFPDSSPFSIQMRSLFYTRTWNWEVVFPAVVIRFVFKLEVESFCLSNSCKHLKSALLFPLVEHLAICPILLSTIRPWVLLSSTFSHYIQLAFHWGGLSCGTSCVSIVTNVFPSARTEITVILNLHWPVILTSTNFGSFISVLMLVVWKDWSFVYSTNFS